MFVGDISPQRTSADGHLSKGIRQGTELRGWVHTPAIKYKKSMRWEERHQWLIIIIFEIIFRNVHLKKVKLMCPFKDFLIASKMSPQILKGDWRSV